MFKKGSTVTNRDRLIYSYVIGLLLTLLAMAGLAVNHEILVANSTYIFITLSVTSLLTWSLIYLVYFLLPWMIIVDPSVPIDPSEFMITVGLSVFIAVATAYVIETVAFLFFPEILAIAPQTPNHNTYALIGLVQWFVTAASYAIYRLP